jgi:hypothetical protein
MTGASIRRETRAVNDGMELLEAEGGVQGAKSEDNRRRSEERCE